MGAEQATVVVWWHETKPAGWWERRRHFWAYAVAGTASPSFGKLPLEHQTKNVRDDDLLAAIRAVPRIPREALEGSWGILKVRARKSDSLVLFSPPLKVVEDALKLGAVLDLMAALDDRLRRRGDLLKPGHGGVAAARANPDVNALLPRPRSPGPWVNETECSVCGAKYKDFRAGCGFREGAQRVRDANGGFAAGGGYRSRSPVLWGMKVCKLDAWYLEHLMCGAAIYEAELKKKAAKLKRRKKAAAAKKAKVAKLDWDQAKKHLGEDPF